ncbi:MAG: GNAT family N-acetyltransferase [Phycisphaerae bacterium]
MSNDNLTLTQLAPGMREAYMDYVDAMRSGSSHVNEADYELARRDYAALLHRRTEQQAGRELPQGYVPQSIYYLLRNGRILGELSLRHRLTDDLIEFGGHIGYGIRPEERNKGYCTEMLGLALEVCRQRCIMRVRITCDSDNAASARVIEKCGGVLDSESYCEQAGRVTRRYWIDLSDEGER